MDNDFINRITNIIEGNISDERFGVSELAQEASMSRSNLLRKIKKSTGVSASQFISQVRLKRAMEELGKSSLTVSEVAYKVGFGSPSYFIKCFRDYYGYPPGEVSKKDGISGQSDDLESRIHQLAAIMFTDIEGYTAMMQKDEEKAVRFRNRHREVFDSVTKKYNGRILQYYGDGTLSTFSSAIDAVRCATEMQLAFRDDPQIPVRIGIHTGDIIVGKDEIIGDGVNIAARIESMALAGSVFISEKVFDEVKNQPGIQTVSMGLFELKNVEKPVEVFAISNAGLVVPLKEQVGGKVNTGSGRDKKEMPRSNWIRWAVSLVVLAVLVYLIAFLDIFRVIQPNPETDLSPEIEKSIAVLPFINDSNDSTNVYLINGLMESTLNNLQKIKDLRVISRTSVEQYRNYPKSIPEIARELNVSYIVEGSGQKIGDQILLNIQLIDANHDKHVWGEQYSRKTNDIFALQLEVAENIAEEIQAVITPEEKERIEKIPTENLEAYDQYLKGQELLNQQTQEGLLGAIPFFEKAVELDDEFALAYAHLAVTYFFLDFGQTEKEYTVLINDFADKALLYDPKLPQSLMAKALFYYNKNDYQEALPHLEKALEYNPNSAWVINMLADYYAQIEPNSLKYLEYALKGLKQDPANNDSVATSYVFMHLSNAFIQTGFIEEAVKYINKSLEYNPENLFAEYIRAYVLYARDRDLQQTRQLLLKALQKDSTRADILSRVMEINYYMRNYTEAYQYLSKLEKLQELVNMELISYGDFAKIGVILSELGRKEEAEKYFRVFKKYAENNQSIYKHLSLSVYYSYHNEPEKAIENLRLFSREDYFYYWILVFVKIDPLFDNIKNLPEFEKVYKDIEKSFREYQNEARELLEREELI